MPPTTVRRRFLAYALHGRTPAGVIDYSDLFGTLSTLSFVNRRAQFAETVCAIAWITADEDGMYDLRFVSGTPGSAPVLFDVATGTERLGELGETEVVATSALAVADPRKRVLVVERRRPGVPIDLIERLLSRLGRDHGFDSLTVSLTPLASEGFLEELDEYERIRRAEVYLARPNYDWTESAAALGDLGAHSNANEVEVAATAPRGESLRKDDGILADIRSFASHPINALRNVRIVGRRAGDQAETALSLQKHQVRQDVYVDRTLPAADQTDALLDGARGFAASVQVGTEEDTATE